MSVYYIHAAEVGMTKIGYAKDVANRLVKMRVDSPVPLECIGVEDGGFEIERQRHAEFADLHVRGEWFRHEGLLVKHTKDLPGVAAKSERAPKHGIKVRDLADRAGISKSYACQFLKGDTCPVELKLHIFACAGIRHSSIPADVTDAELLSMSKAMPYKSERAA